MKTKLLVLSLIMMAVAVAVSFTAFAAIPHLMNYQGKATNSTGAPLNGTYSLTFRIYNAETGGSPKWSESQPNIAITNGIFQVQLGSLTPLNLSFDEPCWISMEINTDGEMSPRTRLASVPYAYRAESLADAPVVPFYKKGFDVQCVDLNSIKIAPGAMDVAGKMFTSATYSSPLLLAYLDNPANRDWVHGQKTSNSTAYVYAYNNNGQIAFKFSDEAPDLSDQYGNTARRPRLYRKYPNTADGIYYRNIGKVYVSASGVILTTDSPTDGVPAGAVMAWTTSNPPDGWLLCNGSVVSRAEYANLFSVISTTYGSGDGSSTFNLPNLKGKVPVGYNSVDTEFNALAKTGGEKAHTITSAEMPAHTHPPLTAVGAMFRIRKSNGTAQGAGGSLLDGMDATTGSTGGSGAHNNLQPYITLNYIIKN